MSGGGNLFEETTNFIAYLFVFLCIIALVLICLGYFFAPTVRRVQRLIRAKKYTLATRVAVDTLLFPYYPRTKEDINLIKSILSENKKILGILHELDIQYGERYVLLLSQLREVTEKHEELIISSQTPTEIDYEYWHDIAKQFLQSHHQLDELVKFK